MHRALYVKTVWFDNVVVSTCYILEHVVDSDELFATINLHRKSL